MRITAKIAYTVRGTKRIYTNQSTQIQSTHLNGSNFANLSSLMLAQLTTFNKDRHTVKSIT